MTVLVILAAIAGWIICGYAGFVLYVTFMKLTDSRIDEEVLILSFLIGPMHLIGMIIVLAGWGIIKLLDPITQRLLEWARR